MNNNLEITSVRSSLDLDNKFELENHLSTIVFHLVCFFLATRRLWNCLVQVFLVGFSSFLLSYPAILVCWDIECWCNFCTGMVDIEKSSLSSYFSTCYIGRPKSPGWLSTISSLWTELISSNCISYSPSVDTGSSEHICNVSLCGITSVPIYHYKCQKEPQEVFCKKRNFGKLTGKHLSQRLFLIKLQVCLWHRCFTVHLWNSKNNVFTEYLGQLLLNCFLKIFIKSNVSCRFLPKYSFRTVASLSPLKGQT